MARCVRCGERKGKRTCRALSGEICAQCCGEHRGRDVECPADCAYLLPADPGPAMARDPFARMFSSVASYAVTDWPGKDGARRAYMQGSKVLAEWERGLLVGYLVHGHEGPDGRRAVESYMAERAAFLGPDDREALESIRDAWFSLFEIEEVRPDEGFLLRDLVGGGEIIVHEREGTKYAFRYDLLLAWIVTHEGRATIAEASMLVQRTHREAILGAIAKARSSAGRKMPGATYEEIGRRAFLPAVHALRAAFEAYSPAAMAKVASNMDGDRIVFSRATWEVASPETVLERLAGRDDFEAGEGRREGDEGVEKFHWIDPEGRKDRGLETLGLGTLTLDGTSLVLETNSRKRLTRGKKLLAGLMGDAIRHAGDEFTPLAEAMKASQAERGGAGGEDAAADASGGIPIEVRNKALRAFQQDYLMKWLDMEIPALGGKTPRQAVRTAGGRAKVIGLLKDFENMHSRDLDGPSIDLAPAYGELGLPYDE